MANGSIVFSLGALMFYYLLYQARLIPRWITGWGILAGIAYLAAGLIALFGISTDLMPLMLPMLVQEMVMAVWLIVKGFSPSAVASETDSPYSRSAISLARSAAPATDAPVRQPVR